MGGPSAPETGFDSPAVDRLLVLDGGLATELEADGFDLNHPLWSARVFLEAPDAIARAHRRFLDAGADCVITATYQASFPGLRREGLAEDAAERVFRDAVSLAISARDRFWRDPANRAGRRRPLVAASVGPYGAFLADGSEYRGDYGIGAAELAAFHERRLRVLAGSGADLLAIETIPSAPEARALTALLEEIEGAPPAWVSFTCRDGERLSDGTPVEQVARDLAGCSGVFALGVNCTHPGRLASLIPIFREAGGKPVVAYPNGAGNYDPASKRWTEPSDAPDFAALAPEWRRLGATLLGGCCGTRADDIRAIRRALAA